MGGRFKYLLIIFQKINKSAKSKINKQAVAWVKGEGSRLLMFYGIKYEIPVQNGPFPLNIN